MHSDDHAHLYGLSARRAPRHNPASCFACHKYLLSSIIQVLQEREHAPRQGPAVMLRVVHAHSQLDADSGPGSLDFTETSAWGELRSGDPHEPRPFALSVFDTLSTAGLGGSLADMLFRLAPVPWAQTASLTDEEVAHNSIVHLAFAPRLPDDPLVVHSCNAAGQGVTHLRRSDRWQRVSGEEVVRAALRHAHITGKGPSQSGNPRQARDVPTAMPSSEAFTSTSEILKAFDHILVRAAVRELQNQEAMESGRRSVWL
ncbi:MAG: hypothetical protein ACT6UH_03080 [Hydrogenophaga sp.]|jgi:hypothetical protein|uniref:hypothetical protein n=1 Tax=unclassified Hydrogenophaga TaxID=2610897 RepID=UPI0036D2409B